MRGLTLREILEEIANFTLAVAAVAAKCANRGELAGLCPAGHSFWIDTKKRSHLRGGQELLGLYLSLHKPRLDPSPCGEKVKVGISEYR